jgi:hypothetical protein
VQHELYQALDRALRDNGIVAPSAAAAPAGTAPHG